MTDEKNGLPFTGVDPELQAMGMSQGLLDVIAERNRQIVQEGFDADHDDQAGHLRELAQAAATYAFVASVSGYDRKLLGNSDSWLVHQARRLWPGNWDGWFKPKTRRQDLVRAAALALAAIDVIDRKGEQHV